MNFLNLSPAPLTLVVALPQNGAHIIRDIGREMKERERERERKGLIWNRRYLDSPSRRLGPLPSAPFFDPKSVRSPQKSRSLLLWHFIYSRPFRTPVRAIRQIASAFAVLR